MFVFLSLLFLAVFASALIFDALAQMMLFINQKGRNEMFEDVAKKYNLQFSARYPGIFATGILIGRAPQPLREIKGRVGISEIMIGDYLWSIWWSGGIIPSIKNFNWCLIGERSRFFIDGKEKNIPVPFLWGLASQNKIISFLDSVK